MANSILTPTAVTREALRVLHQKLRFIGTINRQYDDSYAKTGAKIGDSLKIRLPNQYSVRTGRTLDVQDTEETSVTLQVSTQKGVDVNFTSDDLTLSLDDFSKRILTPAMSVLAANIEADAFNMHHDVYNLVGSAGTTPATFKLYMQARQKLIEGLMPEDGDASLQITPESNVEIVDVLKGLFHDGENIKKQYRDGLMGRTAGFDWFQNTLCPTHTNGSQGGTPLVDGATQTGAVVHIDGVTSGNTWTKGTVFTIGGVYRVHPETKEASSELQQFVVTADTTFTSGEADVPISPSIVITGAKQNVSASAADGEACTVLTGSASTGYEQNLAYHKDAFAIAFADLIMPGGVDFARRETMDGISMRIVRQYDINNDALPCRIDVMYGYKAIRPELACRMTH